MSTAEKQRCQKSVATAGMGIHFHQCYRKAVAQEGGKHYCKQHLPSVAKAKREARDKKWDAERNQRQAEYEREAHMLSMFTELLGEAETMYEALVNRTAVVPPVLAVWKETLTRARKGLQ